MNNKCKIINRLFSNVINPILGNNYFFHCIGDFRKFADEINVLTNSYRMTSGRLNDSSCFLIDLENIDVEDTKWIISSISSSSLILLYVEAKRKTKYLEHFELFNFRIMFERFGKTYLTNHSYEPVVIENDVVLGDKLVLDGLQNSFRKLRNLPKETPVEIVSVNANQLLKSERFDIAIKCLYARLWKNDLSPSWRDYVYYHQALRITGSGREIVEYDGSGKSGLDNFLEVFHSLLTDIRPESIPLVPVDKNYTAFDGAHRIAGAIVSGREVRTLRVKNVYSPCIARYGFFNNSKQKHTPCPEEILDESALEYIRVKQGLSIAVIFPNVPNAKFAINTLAELGKIVYEKKVVLDPVAGECLLRQVYFGHDWFENNEVSNGFTNKVKKCFPYTGIVHVVLLDNCQINKIRTIKNVIRAHYGLGHHSIHITDGDEEVLRLARVLFNNNSIDLLKMGISCSIDFNKLLSKYQEWLEVNGLDDELVAVSGSSLLGLLGLRECRDIDFLYHGNDSELPNLPHKIDSHNKIASYFDEPLSEIIGDPRLHCWYMGIKFCSPQVIWRMKTNRGEIKDVNDAHLLKAKMLYSQPPWLKGVSNVYFKIKGSISASAYRVLKKMKRKLSSKIRPNAT